MKERIEIVKLYSPTAYNYGVKISNQSAYGRYMSYEAAKERADTLSYKTGLKIVDTVNI